MRTYFQLWPLTLCLTVAGLGIGRAASPVSYDLSRDFSIVANPNGVWSYGWKTTLDGAFSPLSFARTYHAGEVTLQDWVLADGQVPQVQYNASTDVTFDNGDVNYPPGTVAITAGPDASPQNFVVLRFTVPSNHSDSYLMENLVENRHYGDASRDTGYHLLVNGVEIFGTNLPPNSKASYTNTLNLMAGDTVDLAAGRSSSGQYNSGLKVRATFTPTTCTPRQAKAEARIVNGFLVGATITDIGCGYTNAPIVLVQGGGGTGAAVRAIVSDGKVTAIQVTDAGCCYTNLPRIVISSPPMVPSVEIRVSKVVVKQNVVLGWKYVLESSNNNTEWTAAGPPFVAETDPIETEFDVNSVGRLFRLRVVP